MSETILPDNIDNFSEDTLFQKELLVGLGEEQFNVRERFVRVENTVSEIKSSEDADKQALSGLTTRLSTLETEHGKFRSDLSGCAEASEEAKTALDGHAGDLSVHVSETLRKHPGDAARHVPGGGVEDQVLVSGPGGTSTTWKAVMSLLPKEIVTIIENGGNVTPEQVIEAFRQITVSVWESGGLPLGADRITASVFAGDRFFVGG